MKTNLLILLLGTIVLSNSFTTHQLLKMIEKPTKTPDISVEATTKTGYGSPEMFDADPRLDAKASILCNISLLSTAEIRRKRELGEKRRAEALSFLSDIVIAEKLMIFLKQQRTGYRKRRRIIEQRIKKDFAEQSEVFPIERHLIDIENKINQQRAKRLKAQLAFAGLAGDNWKNLFESVKLWDKKL